jgi:NADPH-dependent ferric siderophore reductase
MAEPAPAPATARRPRTPRLARVISTERLTPRMIRVVLGGEGLDGFEAGEFTDHYVKLQLPPKGAGYAAPFDVEDIKARLPKEQWPRTRTYTVRAWDAERGELTIDVVVHGDEGVAGPWAAAAQPGDTVQLNGPGGAYTPDPAAAWHLLVGDPSVVPAISASLARIPAGVPVHVLLEVDGRDDEQPLETPGELHVTWLHGGPGAVVPAVEAYDFPDGPVSAFVHGEAGTVRLVRRHLLVDRAIPREAISVSGYWKQTRTDEDWRAEKPEWNRLVEEDVAGAR